MSTPERISNHTPSASWADAPRRSHRQAGRSPPRPRRDRAAGRLGTAGCGSSGGSPAASSGPATHPQSSQPVGNVTSRGKTAPPLHAADVAAIKHAYETFFNGKTRGEHVRDAAAERPEAQGDPRRAGQDAARRRR